MLLVRDQVPGAVSLESGSSLARLREEGPVLAGKSSCPPIVHIRRMEL
jgi:hypothetical protein